MKKLSAKQKMRLYRLNRYRLQRDSRCRVRKQRERLLYRSRGTTQTLRAPVCFSLDVKHAQTLLRFTEKLATTVADRHIGRIVLDFSATSKMIADGTLYFLAVLDDLCARFPTKHLILRKPSDVVVEQVLLQTGVARLLGYRKPYQTECFHESVKYWHCASGCQVDAQQAQTVFEGIQGTLTDELNRSVYTGITEAMTNCHHHAYDDTNTPAHLRKWWLFSREYEQSLQVVFCDLGIGIPKSLFAEDESVAETWFEQLKSWLKEQIKQGKADSDALKIKAAIEIGRSRTKLHNRGKGLQQMVQILDRLSDNRATVKIISGNGVYERMPRRDGRVTDKLFPLSLERKFRAKGTMVYWQIPLPVKEVINE